MSIEQFGTCRRKLDIWLTDPIYPIRKSSRKFPNTLMKYYNDISAKVKKRVDLADVSVNERRCLIENCPNERAVHYRHLVDKKWAKDEKIVTSLEWYWQLEHGELDLDTRYNIFFAGASLHTLHDNDSWGLLPPEDLVNQYYNKLRIIDNFAYANRETFPIIPVSIPLISTASVFIGVTLIPLKASMKSIFIARQEIHAQNRPLATTDFKIHVHPFDELPDFQSHLHPKFAIVELGRKLSKLDPDTYNSLILSSPIYSRIRAIFVAWTNESPLPNNDLLSGWFNSTNDDDSLADQSALPVSQVETKVLSSWMDYNNDVSTKAKKRVDLADASINQRRCLIENCPNERAVQYCHLFAKEWTKDENLMTSLEWFWRLKHRELNLDTRYNIFFAGASLHVLHNNDSWGLLPPEDSINQYYNKLRIIGVTPFAHRETFPIIPNGVFSYRLIPLKASMRSICIARQENHALDQPVATTDFKFHVYPFDELPEIRSHIHPKFAIVELGRKLSELCADTLISLFDSFPVLSSVLAIFVAWTGKVTPPEDGFQSYWVDPENGDGQSETSTKTGPDSTRALRDERVAGLSHDTLEDHEHDVGKQGWTRESLLSWAESVEYIVEDEHDVKVPDA
ncbi:hypothetical protein AGABI1DRAFT_131129 [Agaricus bisporus var. burnettii JB137-S8]|uniref:HNH nuclease domain-containing protein n=1 Tax=Agaricus bisporus var. burnettii (strain JB137-S8 / ATCC MYA-4627 / FGSC 10392) TaxID=597362 RepID=K5VQ57_AGABU|nr:uncharacterized protein AGABI1DRAFT_131129 [Agaricus bisporus var. burnettii JB137-S8]EKM76574.1 hypothetical protein AGABI1DRAFT_131129 [Agaricus bisporus var. burnettii JB137-S8]